MVEDAWCSFWCPLRRHIPTTTTMAMATTTYDFALSPFISIKFLYARERAMCAVCMQWICKRLKWAHLVLNSISFGNIMCYIIIIIITKNGKKFIWRQHWSAPSTQCITCAEICIHTHSPLSVSYGIVSECDAVSCTNVPTSSRLLDLTQGFPGSMRQWRRRHKRPKTTIGYVRVVFRALVYEQLICMYDITPLHAWMHAKHRANEPTSMRRRHFMCSRTA